MKSPILGLAVLTLIVGVAWQAKGDLIVNGGFETGDFTGWTTGSNSFPQSIVGVPVNSGNFAAQIAGFSSNPDTLSQTIATTVGQTYDLSFSRFQAGGQPPISLTVTWDGTPVFSEVNPGAQPYQTFSFQVVGTGSDTLVFTSANDKAFTYLDDVSVNAVNAVPLPSTLVMSSIMFGMVGVAWSYRRLKDTARIASWRSHS